jgi:hypothetical protein
LAASAESLYAFFLLFSSLGPIRPSGGFSDLQKRQDFEGRAPRRHKTVGFGTRGSARTTQNHVTRMTRTRILCFESAANRPLFSNLPTQGKNNLPPGIRASAGLGKGTELGFLGKYWPGFEHLFFSKTVGFGTYGSPTNIRFKRNVNERRLCIESECMISVGHLL